MRNSLFTLKKQMLTLAFVCLGFPLMAEQINVTVNTRDTERTGVSNFSNLEQAFIAAGYTSPEELAAITDLKVTTEGKYSSNNREFGIALDANDFAFLNAKMTALANLDLSGALVTNNYGEGRDPNNSIPNNAFQNNKTIKSIKLPSSLVNIGGNAFVNCALEGIINIPKGVSGGNLESSRFGNSQGITGFQADEESTSIITKDGVVFSKDMSLIHFYPCGKTDESYIIPEGVVTIRNTVFEDNHHLKNLTFASTTTAVQTGFDVIACHSEIENIYVAEGNPILGSANGILYQLENNRAVWSPRGKTEVRISEPIQKIAGAGTQNAIFGGNRAGNNYTNVITLVDFPSTLEEVENGAFVGASNLATVICRAINVPKNGAVSFNAIGGELKPQWSTKVYVPANSLAAYKASTWVDNTKIMDGDKEITYKGFAQNNFFAFYDINLTNATAESSLANDIAAEGDQVTITANEAPAGKEFDKWTSTTAGVTFTDANAESTTFTMPAADVEIIATYKTPTNINEGNQVNGTNIYANNGVIYINTDKAQTMNIYSIDGRIIKSVKLNPGSNKVTGITEGIYLVNKQKIML